MAERDQDRYEGRDLSGRWLLVAFGCIAGGMVLALLIAYAVWQGNRFTPAPPSPVAADAPPVPEPRLQAAPEAELAAYFGAKRARLHGRGWVDREAGIAHIPIEQAMRRVADEGLPRWPAPPPDAASRARAAREANRAAGAGAGP